jgi:hypothetical protein
MAHDDEIELIVAKVSCVNAPWISPHNRGKRDALVTLHNNDHFLWTERGDTIGWVRIISAAKQMTDLVYVPEKFVGQDLISDSLYLLKYICPISGKTVQEEIQELSSRLSSKVRHPVGKPAVKVGGMALGYVAKVFVDRAIGKVLDLIRQATHSGYHEVSTGNLYFDAPIKESHLSIRTVGELRRAGLMK